MSGNTGDHTDERGEFRRVQERLVSLMNTDASAAIVERVSSKRATELAAILLDNR